MKLARYRLNDGPAALGLVVPEGVVELRRHLPDIPSEMAALIAEWERWRPLLAALPSRPDWRTSEIELLAPVPNPEKILCIGLNYRDHAEEVGLDLPKAQLWFSKTPNTVAGGGGIPLPQVSDQLDYEAELVVVIGKTCRHVARRDAAAAIFGYMVGNDVSVRDWQMATSQFLLGKCFDGHAPTGPWIVTADGFRPEAQRISCRVNGEVRQQSNIGNMVFGIDEMIEHVSKVMTLRPGDLLFTGTPGGVGMGHKPPAWLRVGDLVQTEIEGLGVLENRVVAET